MRQPAVTGAMEPANAALRRQRRRARPSPAPYNSARSTRWEKRAAPSAHPLPKAQRP